MSRLIGTPIDGVEGSLEERGDSDASSGDTIKRQAPPTAIRRRRHARSPRIEKEWYSKREAARYLGMAEITVTRYLEKGILHAQRLPTPDAKPRSSEYDYGRLRIHRSELDRYLESADRGPNESVVESPASQDTYNSSKDADVPVLDKGEELMTRQEVAVRLGVSWRTIDRYIKSGILKLAGYFKCPDSYTRAHVYSSDVEKLLQRGDSSQMGQDQARNHSTC